VYPVIQTAIATQRIKEIQAEAARAALAREARRGRSPRLSWLFDLAGRREAARLAQHGPDVCCPDYLLTGRCAEHAGQDRVAADSRGAS
jgi:hypothetical protein